MLPEITLKYLEAKKYSAVYVVEGTEKDAFPSKIYIRRNWIGNPTNWPLRLTMTLAVKEA